MVVYILGEFLSTAWKVWMTFQIVAVNAAPRYEAVKERWIQGIVAASIAIWTLLDSMIHVYTFFSYTMLASLLVISVSLCILYRGNWLDGAVISCLFWGGLELIHFFFLTLIYLFTMQIGHESYDWLYVGWKRGIYLSLFCVVTWKFGAFEKELIYFLKRMKKRKQCEVIFLLLFTLVMLSFERICTPIVSGYDRIGWILLLVILFSVGVGLLGFIGRLKIRENEKFLQLRLNMMEENYIQIVKLYQEKANLLHDEKHHMRVLDGMLENGEVEQSRSYIRTVVDDLKKSGKRVWSGHRMLDLILNIKSQEAERLGIIFEIQLDDMSELKLEDKEICVLFSNLLDNAIEANQKVREQRWIRLCGERKGHMFILNMSNAVGEKVCFEGEKLVSSKPNKELHGFGLQSVHRIVEKYQGEQRVVADERRFLITIYLIGFE